MWIEISGSHKNEIKVFSSEGLLVLEGKPIPDKGEIDISSLNNGIYLLQVSTPQRVVSTPFVVKH